MTGKENLKKIVRAALFFAGIFEVFRIMAKYVTGKNRHYKQEKDLIDISKKETIYERLYKPILDKVLAFGGLIVLSPMLVILSIAVFVDDPGPVFFTQERIGKNKNLFRLHKFRTMRMNTPHDVPTHQLKDPEQYITRVGKFLRKYSLDELPQIWDIFIGNMSIIGPRPALWNQDDLVAERDKYGANNILPGLTGWAQINGRDELEIAEKARLDGKYVEKLRQGGWRALLFDMKCFLGTVRSVLESDGVVEGGTGEMRKRSNDSNYSINEIYEKSMPERREGGLSSTFIKLIIVGEGSYIGSNIEQYLNQNGNYKIKTLNAVNFVPDPENFRGYDVVLYVAGIAHRRESRKNAHLYYEVNRDLAVETAKTAKMAGVPHFIILSSMSVYGMKTGHITKDTVPCPKNHYGKSKLEADNKIWQLRDKKFRVSIFRPPIVYGNECKGNYQRLRKMAVKIPFFPSIDNKRSMIYIENLCEFTKQIIEGRREGIFFPQNAEYVSTYDFIKQIAACNRKKIKPISFFNSLIENIHLELFDKVFGNLTYEEGDIISKVDFRESVRRSETVRQKKPKIVVVTSYTPSLFWYRLDMMRAFQEKGYEVYAFGDQKPEDWEEKFRSFGIIYKQIYIQRNGINPLNDLRTIVSLLCQFKEIMPSKIFTYQAKSTIYGGIAAQILKISDVYSMVGGIGSVFLSDTFKARVLRNIVVKEYKIALKKAAAVFFQNKDDEKTFRKYRIISQQKVVMVHGSGVNIRQFSVMPYPEKVTFLLTARLIRDKGVYEYLEACKKFKKVHKSGICLLVGPFDSNPTALKEEELRPYIEEGIVEYFGEREDIRPYLKQCSVFILPSYREGTPKAILEAMACGRAVITTDAIGCRETVRNGENGFLVPVKDVDTLFEKMVFLYENPNIIEEMGAKGREMAEKIFDVDIVNAVICQAMEI